jgi:Flp pilus assembly protein TadD
MYADAERIEREVHGMMMRVLGAEHPHTLTSASNLAMSLLTQGKYADAERIQREVLEVRKRVLGAENPHTLTSANNPAMSLSGQGKYADAERIEREVLDVQTLVLGAEHPNTLTSANNLAVSLSSQGKHAEAEQMLHVALASLQRVLGPAHPDTLATARCLEDVRAHSRATPPTNAAAPAAAGAARLLPAGTRVLVQRLVSKPEHNGKRAHGVVRCDHRPVCGGARRWEGAVAQGRVRGEGRVRGGGMRVGGGGGEQRVLSMPGGAVLLARVPAHGLEGAQAGVCARRPCGGTAMSGRVLGSYVP